MHILHILCPSITLLCLLGKVQLPAYFMRGLLLEQLKVAEKRAYDQVELAGV